MDRWPPAMSVFPDERIRAACVELLRGDHSVVDFTYAFRAAMTQLPAHRPLDGVEVDLFHELEEWFYAMHRQPSLQRATTYEAPR